MSERKPIDPAMAAAMAAALRAAQDRYGKHIQALMDEMEQLLGPGRLPTDLAGAEAVTFMALQARFEAEAEEFLQDVVKPARPVGTEERRRRAGSLMQRHLEQFEVVVLTLLGQTSIAGDKAAFR